MDNFVGYNNPASAAFTFVADMQLTNEVWVKWEAAALFATANCNSVEPFIWPLIYDSRLLERILSICQVAWDVSETNTSFHNVVGYCISDVILECFLMRVRRHSALQRH